MASFINIKGGEELAKALQQLPVKIEKNILRSALRAGANVIKNEAKSNVPVDDGDLKRSLKVSVDAKRGRVTAKVKAGNKKVFYTHFVEFGTAAHIIKPKGRITAKKGALSFNGVFVNSVNHPGARAKPFMRPALDAKANEAIVATGNKIKQRLTAVGINTPDFGVGDE